MWDWQGAKLASRLGQRGFSGVRQAFCAYLFAHSLTSAERAFVQSLLNWITRPPPRLADRHSTE